MVNTMNVSKFDGSPPEAGESRKIKGGPIYSQYDLEPLLKAEELIPWTDKCKKDLQKESLDVPDVVNLIRVCLKNGKFKGSEWCQQMPNGAWAACDAYQILVSKWNEFMHKDMDIEYYVKFAIAKTGRLILTVSCHGPEERY